jgi:hypothetical protein
MVLSSWKTDPTFHPNFCARSGPISAPRRSSRNARFSASVRPYSGNIVRYGSASTAKFGKKFFMSGAPVAVGTPPPNQFTFATRFTPGIAASRGSYDNGRGKTRLTRLRITSRSVLVRSIPP